MRPGQSLNSAFPRLGQKERWEEKTKRPEIRKEWRVLVGNGDC